MAYRNLADSFKIPKVIRRLLLSWLIAASISYLVLPQSLQNLETTDGISQMSFVSMVVMTLIFATTFTIIGFFWNSNHYESWLIVLVYTTLTIFTLIPNFSWPFLVGCILLWLLLLIYAIKGWDSSFDLIKYPQMATAIQKVLLYTIAAAFVAIVSIWTVCRIYSYCTPTYDFGIFSQMFYNMKTTGIPNTTVERDVMLSHFQVHVSPIYYLLLPVYFLFPFPATLQILQAIILASTIIPLWLLCRRHGLAPGVSILLCAVLLLYPAFSGGTSYDIHENAFLAPLIMWLLYGLDAKNIPITVIAACLTLLVKEDAAVYVAIIALYILIRASLRNRQKHRQWELLFGSFLLVGSIVWFLIVTGFLAKHGDGVMTYRYQNFMTDSSGSLLDVLKAVFFCPLKVIYECFEASKVKFIYLTLFPLLGTPFITRKYERFILLIPYLLVNLMSDYTYQHDIFFQYTYGSTACLLYLTVVNIADFKQVFAKNLVACVCLILCGTLFVQNIIPVAARYPLMIRNNHELYRNIHQTLEQIPDDASVAATTFYTTQLSQRETLYDVKYTSTENLLSAEYIALAIHSETNYKQYEIDGNDGYENLVRLLEQNGYTIFSQLDNVLVIYQKAE